TFYIRSVERQLDHCIILFDLVQCEVHHAKGVFYLEPSWIIMLRSIHRKEHCVHTTFSRSWEVDGSIRVSLADIGSHQKLPGHYMRVSVHYQGFAMKFRHLAILKIQR